MQHSLRMPIAPLPQSMTSQETWGFGFSGLLLWLGTASTIHAALGPQAIWVWLPGSLVGMLVNLQVKRLGHFFPTIAGGTPNYITRLLDRWPHLARYGAIGYLIGWVSVPAVNAIILTDLIETNLMPLGLNFPEIPLRIGFTILPFILAFSGTRPLGILHAFFVFPAIGFLLTFCVQGLVWLSFGAGSPGLLPQLNLGLGEGFGLGINIALVDWMKWFLIAVYAAYGCETASSFVAESRQTRVTLKCLQMTAGLIPIVYLGGSWVLMRLSTNPGLGNSVYLNLLSASQPFWGIFAPALVTFLITSGCLLSSTTSVSNCPRILYQLARDRYLPPVFATTSQRGVLSPSLFVILGLSLLCLVWGDVARIVMVTGIGYLISMMALHLGEWVSQKKPETRWPRFSLFFFAIESAVLVMGGLAWGWQDLAIGLLLPAIVSWGLTKLPLLTLQLTNHLTHHSTNGRTNDQTNDRINKRTNDRLAISQNSPKNYFQSHNPKHSPKQNTDKEDWLVFQVTILIGLLCSALSIGWWIKARLDQVSFGQLNPVDLGQEHSALFIILLVTVSFVGVAIACWTTLPQIAAITQAREEIEETLINLQQTQTQLIHVEKMSSLGQLVAGVAHEVNHPINLIHSNLKNLRDYTQNLMAVIECYEQYYPDRIPEIQNQIHEIDLAFLQAELPKTLRSMQTDTDRIREIVLSLRNFSRLDESDFKVIDIHAGIDSTLLILGHRLKAIGEFPAIKVVKNYRLLPRIECYPGQLNQVFMNVLSNAIDAIDARIVEHNSKAEAQVQIQAKAQVQAYSGQITIRTSQVQENWIEISIADNGVGMCESIQQRIFDPFFTTKPMGTGTGMGLSISYQIITQTLQGRVECFSTLGKGTEFVIYLPIQQDIM